MILLKMLPYAILILAFLFVMAWVIGNSQAKANYQKDYDRLVMYVRKSLLKRSYYDLIKQKFSDIENYKCRDKERLSVLKSEFDRKFENYDTLPDEHSPENLDDSFLPDMNI